MAIEVACQCGRRFRVKEEHAGKRIKCPGCGGPVRVPDVNIFVPVDRPPPPAEVVPSRRPFWKDPVVVVGAAVPSLILAAFLGYLYRHNARASTQAYVARQKAEADRLTLAGQTEAAFEAYDRLSRESANVYADDSQSLANVAAAAAAAEKLRPVVEAERKRVADAAKAKAEKAARLAEYRAEVARLAEIRGEIAGTAFINFKGGDHRILPGLRIALLKAEVPKASVRTLLDRSPATESIHRKAGVDSSIGDDEIDFFNRYLSMARSLEGEGDEFPVDVRVFYALDRVSTILGDPAKVWPDAVKTALVSETHTSVEGRFKFEDVQGGSYYLWAAYTMPRSLAEWVVPVRVDKAATKGVDLHNDMATLIINAP